nr:PREDICTED: cuticle protein 18.6-like [Bemisia tabaci]
MAFKLFIISALMAVASCEYKASSSSYVKTAPSYGHEVASHGSYGHEEASHGSYGHESYHDSHPAYKFAYSVHDPHTHDVKAQEETRDGHHVKGFYSLYEADGSKRVVHYADNGHGFEATVHKEGGHHPVSAPVHHPVAAPVHHPVAAHSPVVPHQPIAAYTPVSTPVYFSPSPAYVIEPAHKHHE